MALSDKKPAIAILSCSAAIHQLEGAISETTMRKLNDVVESRQRTESQAAADSAPKLGVKTEVSENLGAG